MQIIEQRDYSVNPFTKIVIGDPLYLVNMETKKSTTKYIVNFNKIPVSNRLTGIILTESEDEILTNNKITIYSFKDMPFSRELIEVHKKGGYVPRFIEEHRYLKNDKKRLAFQVDKNRCIMDLDDAGDCGHIFVYKKNIGFVIEVETNDIESFLNRNANIIGNLFTNIKERE